MAPLPPFSARGAGGGALGCQRAYQPAAAPATTKSTTTAAIATRRCRLSADAIAADLIFGLAPEPGRTRYTVIGSAMFLTRCSPIGSKPRSSLALT